jgi:imidazolonepropionase-like amidohydrolase
MNSRLPLKFVAVALSLMFVVAASRSGRAAPPAADRVQGTFTIYLILHAIGQEQFTLASNPDGTRTLTTAFEYTDRTTRRTTTATLTTTADERPVKLEVQGGAGSPASAAASVDVNGATTTVKIGTATRTMPTPGAFAAVIGPTPFGLQMMMLRAWHARGEPKALPLVNQNAAAAPLEIVRVGQDVVTVDGRRTKLDRYTVNNLMFGREIVWTTPDGMLAAAMTFAGGLPMEAVRNEFVSALPVLYRAGVAQQMADLAAIGREVPAQRPKTFAIAGATLIDATGAAPIADAVVIVKDGRIAAAGARAATPIPRGMTVIDGTGQTLLPGLWEMHTHASGVEFGPALLAAGITTARDCGGEMDYLIAARDAIERQQAIGPRLLLAGLIDSGGPRAFGHVTAETPDEARAVVARYHAARFEQIKLYSNLTPEVVKAIADEAHRLGMTLTGHVPVALTTMAGIEAGMDQINHLNYVTTMMRTPVPAGTGAGAAATGSAASAGASASTSTSTSTSAGAASGAAAASSQGVLDVESETARRAVQFLHEHHTVVDPTSSWGEMASHSREVDVASFEPGILESPAIVDAKYRGMEGALTAEQTRARLATNLAVIGALHRAGVPVVPGSDTGLVGHGLHREIEIYVEAGMTPLEAIRSATIVSAQAMRLDREVGTVEVGKRADLILVKGNPLADIRVLRQVTRVITQGRIYDPAALWRSVGFGGKAAGERSPVAGRRVGG